MKSNLDSCGSLLCGNGRQLRPNLTPVGAQMLTGHHAEREALDLDAHRRGSQAFLCCNLRQIGRGDSKPVGEPLGCSAGAGLDKCFEFHARSLVTDKPICQAFDCCELTKQTADMEIEQIRRDRLKAWFKDRTLPPREKSYLSQLITGASSSFGEKAARRLEKTYEMPTGYLDTPLHADPAQARAKPVNPVVAEFEWAYNNVNDAGKAFLLSSIHAAKAGFMVKRKSKTA